MLDRVGGKIVNPGVLDVAYRRPTEIIDSSEATR
jgi:hypothetical protein